MSAYPPPSSDKQALALLPEKGCVTAVADMAERHATTLIVAVDLVLDPSSPCRLCQCDDLGLAEANIVVFT